MKISSFRSTTMVLLSLLGGVEVAAQGRSLPPSPENFGCGPWVRRDAPAPRDFRSASKSYIAMVEDNHFTPMVENLVKPMFQYFGADIKYTLHAFPNHHRALASLAELVRRERKDPAVQAILTLECYFQRALIFAPDDLVPRMLYAQYLGRGKRNAEAVAQLDYVIQSAPDQALTHYNVGLILFEMGEFDRALVQAHRAQKLGMPRTALKEHLVSVGKWREAVELAVSQPDTSPASAPRQ